MSSPRALACLWASTGIAALGKGILAVGLLAWTYQARESATTVSMLVVAWLLPSLLLGPLAARLITGRTAWPAAIAAQLVTAAALVPLLRVSADADLSLVLAATFASAVPIAFLEESRSLLLPAAAGQEHLPSAGRALSNTRLIALTVGPAAGTIVYGATGYTVPGLSGCAAAALAALLLSTVLILFARPSEAIASEMRSRPTGVSLAGLQKGLLHVWHTSALRTAAAVWLATALLTGGMVVTQVALMVWGIFTSPEDVGLVLAAEGLGMAMATVGRRFLRGQLSPDSRVAVGLGLVAGGGFGLAIVGSLREAIPCAVAIGLGLAMLVPALADLVSSSAAPELRCPAIAGLKMAMSAAVILSAIVSGPLADLLKPRFAMVLPCILLAILALYAFGAPSAPDMEEMEKDKEVADSERTAVYDVLRGVPGGHPLE